MGHPLSFVAEVVTSLTSFSHGLSPSPKGGMTWSSEMLFSLPVTGCAWGSREGWSSFKGDPQSSLSQTLRKDPERSGPWCHGGHGAVGLKAGVLQTPPIAISA